MMHGIPHEQAAVLAAGARPITQLVDVDRELQPRRQPLHQRLEPPHVLIAARQDQVDGGDLAVLRGHEIVRRVRAVHAVDQVGLVQLQFPQTQHHLVHCLDALAHRGGGRKNGVGGWEGRKEDSDLGFTADRNNPPPRPPAVPLHLQSHVTTPLNDT